jgi:replicative DNA helicase
MSFDVDFERDVITLAAKDPKFRRNVRRSLAGADPWSTPALRIVWGIVSQLGERDSLTPKIVAKRLEIEDDDDIAEATAKLAKRVLKGKTTAPEYAAEELRKWVRKDAITRTLGDVVRDMKVGDIAEAERRLAKLTRSVGRIVIDEVGDWFEGWDERQARRLEEKLNPDLRPRVRTRMKRLDKIITGGLAPEQLGLVLAHTGVGKSIATMGFAFYAAAAEVPTIYISTEMSKDLVDTRLDSRFFSRPPSDFMKHAFTKYDLEEFEERRERLRKRLEGNLLTVATPVNTLTKSMIEGYIDDMEERGRAVKLVVVDCADHMVPEVLIKEKRLQQMAKIADVVLTLNQTPKERMDDRARLYVAKNRTGEKGAIIDIKANYAHSTLEEMKEEEKDP